MELIAGVLTEGHIRRTTGINLDISHKFNLPWCAAQAYFIMYIIE